MTKFAGVSGILATAFCVLITSTVSGQETDAALSVGLKQLTAADTPLRKGEKIAFFGDSITMQGGHIRNMRTAINQSAHTKDLGVELFQHGLNGGRVPTVLEGKSKWGDLGGTMQALIEKDAPTVIVIYLGINDVWHGKNGTSKPDFEAGLKQMVAMSKKAGATVILCTPSVIGEKLQGNKFSEQLDEYAAITRKLAADEGVALCDIHEAFLAELKRVNVDNQNKGYLTKDGVHMNTAGNALLADQISQCLVRTLKERNSAKAKANPASLAPSSVPPK